MARSEGVNEYQYMFLIYFVVCAVQLNYSVVQSCGSLHALFALIHQVKITALLNASEVFIINFTIFVNPA